ncbi:cytochrome b, partial [Neisseria sp. P0001.S005]
FSAIPVIGPDLSTWIRGDFNVSDVTLNRFFALHVIAVPLVLLGLVVAHIIALHEVGSNNPDGVEIKKNKDENGIPRDGIPFHPYYTVKDILGVVVFLIVFCSVLFFAPEGGGYFLEAPNFDAANALKTPPHIAPVWYFTPFYAILRAIPSMAGTQVWGVIGMGAAVVLIALLPWLDKSPVKSVRYRNNSFKVMLALFVVSFIGLGILGALVADDTRTAFARAFSAFYFLFFIGMPLHTNPKWLAEKAGGIKYLISLFVYAALIIYNLYLVAVLPNNIVKAFVLAYTVFFAAIPFLNAFNSEKATPERVTMSTTKQKIMFFVYVGITVVGAYLFATNI